jgi:hypothetical protein
MTKTPAPYTGWMQAMMQAITLKEKLKIKVAKWGTPKTIFKKSLIGIILIELTLVISIK